MLNTLIEKEPLVSDLLKKELAKEGILFCDEVLFLPVQAAEGTLTKRQMLAEELKTFRKKLKLKYGLTGEDITAMRADWENLSVAERLGMAGYHGAFLFPDRGGIYRKNLPLSEMDLDPRMVRLLQIWKATDIQSVMEMSWARFMRLGWASNALLETTKKLYENVLMENVTWPDIWQKIKNNPGVYGEGVDLRKTAKKYGFAGGEEEKFVQYITSRAVSVPGIEVRNGILRRSPISVEEWLQTLPEQQARLISKRLDGCTLEECKEGVTREWTRQLVGRTLADRPYLLEDDFGKFYERYSLPKEAWMDIFGMTERQYYFLRNTRDMGEGTAAELAEDPEAGEEVRRKAYAFCHRDEILIGDTFFPLNKTNCIRAMMYEKASKEPVPYEKLYEDCKAFMSERNISPEYCPETLHNFTALIQRTPYALHTIWHRARYYDFESLDIADLISHLHLDEYRDKEISTRLLVRKYSEYLQSLDIRDEYELHNILKQTESQWNDGQYPELPNVRFGRSPVLMIGNTNRTKQIREFMGRYDDLVDTDTFTHDYGEEYGFLPQTVRANFSLCVRDGLTNRRGRVRRTPA